MELRDFVCFTGFVCFGWSGGILFVSDVSQALMSQVSQANKCSGAFSWFWCSCIQPVLTFPETYLSSLTP